MLDMSRLDVKAVVIKPDGSTEMVRVQSRNSDELSDAIIGIIGGTAKRVDLKPKGGKDKGAVIVFGCDRDQSSNAAASEFILLRGKFTRGKNPIIHGARGVAIILGQWEDGTIKNDCPTWVYNTLRVPWTEFFERQVLTAEEQLTL